MDKIHLRSPWRGEHPDPPSGGPVPGPVSGFVTKRLTTADGEGMFPIYIHPAARQPEDRRQYGPDLASRCDSRRSARYTPVEWGPRLLAGPGLLVMDELGFSGRDASRFQAAVLAFRGPAAGAGGGKKPGRPFLRAVRSVPGIRVLYHPGQPGGVIPRLARELDRVHPAE